MNLMRLVLMVIALGLVAGGIGDLSAKPRNWQNPQVEKKNTENKQAVAKANDIDRDLEQVKSATVRNRVRRFRQLIRKQRTRQAKINKALKLMNNPKSQYRPDAIMFLAEVKAQGILDDLYRVAKKEKTLRGHVAMAYGQIGNPRGIPYLIRLLGAPSPVVRRGAHMNLVRLSKVDFDFDEEDSVDNRKKTIEKYKTWWERNKDNLKKAKPNPEDQAEAEKKWELYGAPYLERVEQTQKP